MEQENKKQEKEEEGNNSVGVVVDLEVSQEDDGEDIGEVNNSEEVIDISEPVEKKENSNWGNIVGSLGTDELTHEEEEDTNDEESEDDETEGEGEEEKPKGCNYFQFLYLVDWMVAFVVYAIFGWVLQETVDPHERYLPKTWVNETRWSYPLEDETIPTYGLVLFVLVPVSVIVITNIGFIYIFRSCKDFHFGMLTLFVSVTFEFTTVGMVKLLSGSYRPNYKELCEANASGNCEKEIHNGQKSFPSGHSSSIFVMMFFTTLYLSGKLGVFSRRGSNVCKFFFVLIPLIAAIFVAVSRTWDYYHRFIDITAGAFIGIFAATFAYLLYYHSLLSNESHLPKDRYEGYMKMISKKGFCKEWNVRKIAKVVLT